MMKDRIKTIITPLIILLIVSIAVPAGLFIPRLFAQEPPPQLGLGSLHRVQILNSTKCSATLTIFKSSNDTNNNEVVINVPPGQCNRFTGEELAAQATLLFQDALDFCQPIQSLPSDDPDRFTDPARASLFWRDGDLCSHGVEVTVTWDGSEYSIGWRSVN